MSEFLETKKISDAKTALDRLKTNIKRYIRGKDDVIDQIVICLIAPGHVLIEDLPGVGKTTLAYCLSKSIACEFSRIQFTSDLLPSDVTGVSIYDETVREFVFKPGPIFANFILADEINRATPKTQSSLLEVMDRGKVTVDGNTHGIDTPFMVLATQNPVDYEGTFPLPESQMDRFLMRLQMGYPSYEDEFDILKAAHRSYDDLDLEPVVTREEICDIQELVPQVFVEDTVMEYILKIVTATRTESEFKAGVSIRGCLSLKLSAQASAIAAGRDFVLPDDVTSTVINVLVHRLTLRRASSDTMEERRVVSSAVRRILSAIPVPL
ncbi:MAG: ATPase [Verrucomicrobia bacterium]|nr:MAG: ATPase [Verrucomicrobiota bacterium]